MDEARLGLITQYRRRWAPIGQRPIAIGERRYTWLYLYAFVNPSTGRVTWLLLPTMNAVVMSIALRIFAEEAGAGPNRQLVLVLDGAGSHTGGQLHVPEHVHLVFLPPYSPELQPVETLWPQFNDATANRVFDDLDEMETVIGDQCTQLNEDPDRVASQTFFHWWSGNRSRLPTPPPQPAKALPYPWVPGGLSAFKRKSK